MDVYDAADLFQAKMEELEVDHRDWERRLAEIKLTSFPDAVSNLYLDHIIPLYRSISSGNIIRDVLCNIAVQQCAYTASPWIGPPKGLHFHVGGLGGSSLPASAIFNWRVPHIANHGWVTLGARQAETDLQNLLAVMQRLYNEQMISNFTMWKKSVADVCASYQEKMSCPFAIVHIADQPSVDLALDVFKTVQSGLMPDAMVLFSGCRKQITRIHDEIVQIVGQDSVRHVNTVTINANEPDRLDGLLIVEMNPASRTDSIKGCVYDVIDADLRRLSPIIREANTFPQLRSLASSRLFGVWSAKDGSKLPYKSTCFAVRGFDKMVAGYSREHPDAQVRESLLLSPARELGPQGRILSLPGGCVVDRAPTTADGIVPIDSVMYYYFLDLAQDSDRHHWLWQDHIPSLPTETLEGDWAFLPGPSVFSHWVMESLLPLAVMAELGINPKLLFPHQPYGWQKLYLELCGYPLDRCKVAEPQRTYQCGHLFVPLREQMSFIDDNYARVHHPLAITFINRMLERAGVTDRSRREKLYVSRLDSRHYRACLNEEHVIKYMTKRGYRIVNGSIITPLEALSIYGNARVIVGPQGAGLYNAVFSPPGCQVVAFFGRPYLEGAIEHTLNLFGLDYAFLACEFFYASDKVEGTASNSHYVVDLLELEIMIDAAEERADCAAIFL